jgi:predicted DNA-binding transcriptional regulator AlpA
MTANTQDQYLRIKELANRKALPERTHTYKSGINKGKTKRLNARPETKGMIAVSEKTIWKWVKDGAFPQPVKLGSGVTVWRLSDIQAWMQSKGLEA